MKTPIIKRFEKLSDTQFDLNYLLRNLNLDTTKPLFDNGGRRSGTDRRQFSFSFHIPKRRSGNDRRSGFDRRCVRYIKEGKAES